MNLKEQRAKLLKEARAIIEKAQAERRDMTVEEQTAVAGKFAEVQALDVKIKQAELIEGVLGMGAPDAPGPDGTPVQAKSLGEHFAQHVKAEGLAQLKATTGFTVSTPDWVPGKAAGDPHLTTGAAWTPVLTTIDTTIVSAYRPRPVVADLLGAGQMSGNAIAYFIEGAVEGGFATVAEGAQKPPIHFVDPTSVTDTAKKIAAYFDMSDEMVEDLPFYVSEINNRALYLLAMFEEQQLINGTGVGTNIRGLLQRSGIQTEVSAAGGAGGADGADAIFRAMTKVQTATGLTADGIIINPADYQALRLSRDANEQYFGGGFFTGQYGNGGIATQPPVWGLRTVVTSAVAAGTAVVGAFEAAATVYRKGGVRVESTNSDAAKFTLNIITTRIEERIALAVRVPAAIVKVTFTA